MTAQEKRDLQESDKEKKVDQKIAEKLAEIKESSASTFKKEKLSSEIPKKQPKSEEEEKVQLVYSTSPHLRYGENIPHIMHTVILALVPATLVGIYFFRWDALRVVVLAIIGCLLVEWAIEKTFGWKVTIYDGSAALTGLLLALNLPSGAPWWLILIGALVAISLGKQVYGGLGNNPFNPALVARVFLLISFPVQMTTWPKPSPLFAGITDAVTEATPLSILKTDGIAKLANLSLMDPFLGNVGGSLGEVSALALLIGAAYLLYKGYISWHIPTSFIAVTAIFSGIFWLIDPNKYASPIFHILTGGLILGAFFMATDMVTSPMTPLGMLIFGAGCGLITTIIRLWGGYPEGVSFAILLMNGTTPLIDRYCKSKVFGEVKVNA